LNEEFVLEQKRDLQVDKNRAGNKKVELYKNKIRENLLKYRILMKNF